MTGEGADIPLRELTNALPDELNENEDDAFLDGRNSTNIGVVRDGPKTSVSLVYLLALTSSVGG